MKKRLVKKFLEELQTIPNISRACEKVGITRNTVYRWRNEDQEFANKLDDSLSYGIDSINDLAESKIISKINAGDTRATIYWLENNKRNYIKPRPASVVRDIYSGGKDNEISTIIIKVDDRKRKTDIEGNPTT